MGSRMRWRGKQREREPCFLTTHLCRCLLQCFLLGEAEEELGGCSQIASAECQKRRREKQGGRGRWDQNGEWVYPPRYLVNVCACECMWVHECARERGRMGKREREKQKLRVSASESTKTMPENRDWGTPCLKCRVPPPNITLTQRSAQSAQDLTIWRNNGCKKEQRERHTQEKEI